MKQILITMIALFIGTLAQAKIQNSQYEVRHQDVIEKASLRACGLDLGSITQVYSEVSKTSVDQGVYDSYFTTLLTIDNTYKVTVKSKLADAYDHDSQEWGIYSIESIVCTK